MSANPNILPTAERGNRGVLRMPESCPRADLPQLAERIGREHAVEGKEPEEIAGDLFEDQTPAETRAMQESYDRGWIKGQTERRIRLLTQVNEGTLNVYAFDADISNNPWAMKFARSKRK